MANRFWVGGAGNWSSTARWSATSGGASGASVPTSIDDAIFDANSGGKFIATVDTAQTVNSITITPSAAVGVLQIALSARLTTNNLTTTGTAGNNRIWFRGTTFGIAIDFVINGAVSISDCDFRDVYVRGTAAPISGTRIGDLRGILGITASAPKTVYWNLAGAQNWSANGWAATSTGSPSTDNFPLAQDTATFTDAGSVTGTITMDAAIPYTGSVDMSGRTSAMTLATTAFTIYGNWANGSGTTLSGTAALTYAGRNTQTITSAGKTFTQALTVDSYGGSVELADALNTGTQTLTVTNGAFDTKNFNVTAGTLSSNNSNVRTITLGSSTVTLSSTITLTTTANLTFNAGTSVINISANTPSFSSGGLTFYDVNFTSTASPANATITGVNTFRNMSVTAPSGGTFSRLSISADQIITGTLTVAGATPIRRIFVLSSTLGITRTLTVNSLSATDCDFRDITIAGAAAGSSPTRAGDCGGNTGVIFPSPKTVYWNLAGINQNFGSTAWALSSGGTPDINNFPLAQDTAVFDNASTVTATINIGTWNFGTVNASTRTSSLTFLNSTNVNTNIYGDWLLGVGHSVAFGLGTIIFQGRGTSTLSGNGVVFNCSITIDCLGTVQLGDALFVQGVNPFTLSSGTFDAGIYNVTTNRFASTAGTRTLKMGSGTWTLNGTGTVWNLGGSLNFYKDTANIVLSDTSATARTFTGGNYSYNKLTIGGATGTSTTTIGGSNQFTELASTKTVAHTIALGSTQQTFGAWTVSGTAGNVVTVTGNGVIHNIAGARVSGVDYLAMGTIGFGSTITLAEFYAGANSTGTGANVILTAAPAATTRYWVGGSGTWDLANTTNWSASSGGAGGASVPRSADAVVFDTLSNATGYTVSVNASGAIVRCGSLTISGPASGNVTWSGTSPLAIHGDVSLAATGITRNYTGNITLTGSTTGRTLTTNGVALASAVAINGVGCGWSLGSALDIGTSSTVTLTNGSFNLATYNLTAGAISSNNGNSRTINFSTGTATIGTVFDALNFGTIETNRANLTVTASTSQINFSASSPTFSGNNQTFYNVSFTSTSAGTVTINGINSFNNLSFTGLTSTGLKQIVLPANQTIAGTLTLSAGTDARMRHFVRSDVIGTTRTLTCGAFSGTDADFRDITIAGAAAPVSGTRFGNCGGNTGITFPAAKTVYWNLGGPQNFFSIAWAASSGGTPAANNIPLAQDTAVFDDAGSATGAISPLVINVGTIDTSARTLGLSLLLQSDSSPNVYGNWISGTGQDVSSGLGTITFLGRGTSTITSNGRTFGCNVTINCLSGTVQLADALIVGGQLSLASGTFDAVSYNVTAGTFVSTSGNRTLRMGSGTWTLTARFDMWLVSNSLTFYKDTANIVISFTNENTFGRTFTGGGFSYNKLTIGGVTSTASLGFVNNNKFTELASTRTNAYTISLGTTTQTVDAFTVAGTAGNVVTVQGTSAASPGTLILTSGTVTTPDYLAITGVRAYALSNTWYAGANSTNNGSLGWIFEAGVVPVFSNNNMLIMF
jgi:hypothetical protein